eukprot:5579449-Heterocapsa_arctica.AAC.1
MAPIMDIDESDEMTSAYDAHDDDAHGVLAWRRQGTASALVWGKARKLIPQTPQVADVATHDEEDVAERNWVDQ